MFLIYLCFPFYSFSSLAGNTGINGQIPEFSAGNMNLFNLNATSISANTLVPLFLKSYINTAYLPPITWRCPIPACADGLSFCSCYMFLCVFFVCFCSFLYCCLQFFFFFVFFPLVFVLMWYFLSIGVNCVLKSVTWPCQCPCDPTGGSCAEGKQN
jgi:hypothetical protein